MHGFQNLRAFPSSCNLGHYHSKGRSGTISWWDFCKPGRKDLHPIFGGFWTATVKSAYLCDHSLWYCSSSHTSCRWWRKLWMTNLHEIHNSLLRLEWLPNLLFWIWGGLVQTKPSVLFSYFGKSGISSAVVSGRCFEKIFPTNPQTWFLNQLKSLVVGNFWFLVQIYYSSNLD